MSLEVTNTTLEVWTYRYTPGFSKMKNPESKLAVVERWWLLLERINDDECLLKHGNICLKKKK